MKPFSFSACGFPRKARSLALFPLTAAAALSLLSSCDDKETPPADTPPADTPQTPAPAKEEEPAGPTVAEAKEELLNKALYSVVSKVADPNRYLALNSDMKELLEVLHTYDEALDREQAQPEERIKTAMLIAGITRDLGAYAKAQTAYEKALATIEQLPQTTKDSDEMKHTLSTAYNGLGACLLGQRKAEEALPWYEKALVLDEAFYLAATPSESEDEPAAITREYVQALANLVDAYRCMGDTQRANDDPSDALETYDKGIELIGKVDGTSLNIKAIALQGPVAVATAKLLMSIGNLHVADDAQKALVAWSQAANICSEAFKVTEVTAEKLELELSFRTLAAGIQNLQQKIKEEQGDTEDEQAPDIQTEPIAPLPTAEAPAAEAAPAAAPAPAPQAAAPAPAPAKPQPAKPANNNKNKRR